MLFFLNSKYLFQAKIAIFAIVLCGAFYFVDIADADNTNKNTGVVVEKTAEIKAKKTDVDTHESYKKELEQANETINFMQKQYEQMHKKNKELEKKIADLSNQLILKEAEFKSYVENVKRVRAQPVAVMANQSVNSQAQNANALNSQQNITVQQQQIQTQLTQQQLQQLQALKNAQLQQQREQAQKLAQTQSAASRPQIQPQTQPTGSVPPPPSTQQTVVLYVAQDGTGLYAGPGANYPMLMKLKKGTMLNVEARQDDWFKVFTLGGMKGFVYKVYVAKAGEDNLKSGDDGEK